MGVSIGQAEQESRLQELAGRQFAAWAPGVADGTFEGEGYFDDGGRLQVRLSPGPGGRVMTRAMAAQEVALVERFLDGIDDDGSVERTPVHREHGVWTWDLEAGYVGLHLQCVGDADEYESWISGDSDCERA